MTDNKVIYSMMRVGKVVPPNRQVLKDISLSYFYGAKIGVIGLNGAGKSSLLRIMAGVDKDFLGEVAIAPGYSVGYLDNQLSSQRVAQQQRLSQIARETGGDAYYPSSREELAKFYDRIRDDLLFRYTIGYVPATPPPSGKFRKIEVRVTRPDLKGAKVRTRSGYLVKGSGSTP